MGGDKHLRPLLVSIVKYGGLKLLEDNPDNYQDQKVGSFIVRGFVHEDNINDHHLIPRIMGGKGRPSNMLSIWIFRHSRCWHRIFDNMTLSDIIITLTNLALKPKSRWSTNEMRVQRKVDNYPFEWFHLFGLRDFFETAELLKRLKRMKRYAGKFKIDRCPSKEIVVVSNEDFYQVYKQIGG